jgi:Uma2 family endonuclease
VVGVPHLIIEILSPSTSKHELKMNLYQANQVAEDWIVDPSNEMIDVYNFRDGAYQFPIFYTKTDSLTISLYKQPMSTG